MYCQPAYRVSVPPASRPTVAPVAPMPPEPTGFGGPLAIAGYLQGHLWAQELKLIPTRANNQPALTLYLADPCAPIWRASSLVVLTLRGNQVSAITRFGDRGIFARFGLPRTLPRD